MEAITSRFARWVRGSTPRSREIVLEVLKASHPTPLPVHQIYHRVLKEFPDEKLPPPPPLRNPYLDLHTNDTASSRRVHKKALTWKPPPDPPNPEHPIRSLKYLKSVVLNDMAQQNLVEKVHSMREPTPEELARKNERPSKATKKQKALGGPRQAPVVLNVKGMIDQWGWVIKTPENLEREKQDRVRVRKAQEGLKALDTKKRDKEQRNAFEAEWGHLNVRRRRARGEKLEKEEEWANVLERGRAEGRAAAERATP